MKFAKTIAIIALSVLLAFSVFFNIFITSMLEIKDVKSFKQVLLCRELINSMNQAPEDDMSIGTESPNMNTPNTDDTEALIPDTSNKVPADATTIYNENGIKIMFVGQELGLLGPTLTFYIENNTTQTLNIYLTDIYIDGFRAEYCGMYCDGLRASKKAYESLSLWESDYSDFSDFPSVIEFVIEIQDATSYYTLVETDPMYLCLE